MNKHDKTYEAVLASVKLALKGLPQVRGYAGANAYLVEATLYATMTTIAGKFAEIGVGGITDRYEHLEAMGLDPDVIARYRAVKDAEVTSS